MPLGMILGEGVWERDCPNKKYHQDRKSRQFHKYNSLLLEKHLWEFYSLQGGTSHVLNQSHFQITRFSGIFTSYSMPAVKGRRCVLSPTISRIDSINAISSVPFGGQCPAGIGYNGVTTDGLIDFTPELRAEAERLLLRYSTGPVFTPPVVSDLDGAITGFRSSGGTNWPGGAYDPETQILYAPSYTSMVTIGLLPPPGPEFSDIRYVRGNVLTGVRYVPRGATPRAPTHPIGRHFGPTAAPGHARRRRIPRGCRS